jgi:hypothetical protein
MSRMEFLPIIIAAIAGLASVVAGGALAEIAREGLSAVTGKVRWAVYLWPVLTILLPALAIFVWSPKAANLPNPEFYRLAAEVIPLLLIALTVEGGLITRLPRGIYIEFMATLLVGEVAAFVAVSGIFASEHYVGGGYGGTGVLAMLSAARLIGGGLLLASAGLLRAQTPAVSG